MVFMYIVKVNLIIKQINLTWTIHFHINIHTYIFAHSLVLSLYIAIVCVPNSCNIPHKLNTPSNLYAPFVLLAGFFFLCFPQLSSVLPVVITILLDQLVVVVWGVQVFATHVKHIIYFMWSHLNPWLGRRISGATVCYSRISSINRSTNNIHRNILPPSLHPA